MRRRLIRCLILFVFFFGYPIICHDSLRADEQKPPPNKTRDHGASVTSDIASALRYYYQGDYLQALPLLRKIDDRMQSMDLCYWIAFSAAKVKKYDLAIRYYRRMLSKQPALRRVRLELAEALVKKGDITEARNEFLLVKKSNPPAGVIRNIDKQLRYLDSVAKKFRWNGFLSQGIQNDDNISSGPDTSIINDALYTIQLKPHYSKVGGKNWLTRFGFESLYDIGEPRGLSWNFGVRFFNSHNLDEYSEYNYLNMDIITGPWWAAEKNIFKIPVGYNDKYFGDQRLSNNLHFDPSIEHFISPRLSITGGYSFVVEKFAPSLYSSSDYTLHHFTAGSKYYFNSKDGILSGYLNYDRHSADLGYLSYSDMGATILYFYKFLPYTTEFSCMVNWTGRRYDDKPIFYGQVRKDNRYMIALSVTKRFLRYFFASLKYNFIDNHSNADLFSYQKNQYTLNIGAVF